MVCLGCGNTNAFRSRTVYEDGKSIEACDRCGDVGFCYNPDVYVDGKPEENLPDDPRTGKPPVFTSKVEKALFLKERKLVECWGKEHGGPSIPPAIPAYDKRAAREEAFAALHHVKQMGRDVRKQEYYRILKERDRAR